MWSLVTWNSNVALTCAQMSSLMTPFATANNSSTLIRLLFVFADVVDVVVVALEAEAKPDSIPGRGRQIRLLATYPNRKGNG